LLAAVLLAAVLLAAVLLAAVLPLTNEQLTAADRGGLRWPSC